ncbi:MAG: hypothetical protein MK116_07165 [Phycisphaerales bacterium]|nr:hypothetical protein [Phycisphaerales bacterium]
MTVSFALALVCGGVPNWEAVRLNDDGGPGLTQVENATASSDDGLIATWLDSRDGGFTIRARLLPTDGSPPAPSYAISSGHSADEPMISNAPDGRVLSAWSVPAQTGWSGRWLQSDGTPDGPVVRFQISGDEVTGNVRNEVLAVGANGNVMIGWKSATSLLYTAVFNPDGTLLYGPTMFGAEDFEFGPLDIAPQGDGGFVVAWIGRDETYFSQPKVRHLDANGTPTGDMHVLNEEAVQSLEITIEAGATGNNLVMWSDRVDSEYVLYSQVITAAGTPTGTPQEVNSTALSTNPWDLVLTQASDDNWAAAWMSRDPVSAEDRVQTRRIAPTGYPADPSDRQCLPPSSAASIADIQLVGHGDHATLLWTSSDGEDTDILHRAIGISGGTDGPVASTSDDTDSEDQYQALVASRAAGGFFSVWLDSRNGLSEVFVRAFNADGEPLADAVRVQDTPAGSQISLSLDIASSESGLAVTWTDSRDGFRKAFVQRYDMDLQPLGGNVTISTWSTPPNGSFSAATQPTVAITDSGQVACAFAWPRIGDISRRDSYIRVLNADGTLGNMSRINPSSVADHNYDSPSIAPLSNGGFGASYVHMSSNYDETVYYRRYDAAGGSPSAPIGLFATSAWVHNPRLASNQNGDVMLATSDTWGDFDGMLIIPMDDTGPIGTPILVSTASGGSSVYQRPAVASDGTRMIAWQEYVPQENGPNSKQIGYATVAPYASTASAPMLLPAALDASIHERPCPTYQGNLLMIGMTANGAAGQGMDGFVLVESNPCPSDLDGSGAVDVNDVLEVISAWGASGSDADLDGNGTVDVDDLLLVLGAFGCQA